MSDNKKMKHECEANSYYNVVYDGEQDIFYVYRDDWYEKIVIQYCPFCGVKLAN